MIIFITGGARSGKSRFAEELAVRQAQPVTYLATAQALDQEMRSRITRHRLERPASWQTIEEPLAVPAVLQTVQTPVLLLDCLSLWVSNLLLADRADEQILEATGELLDAVGERTVILVTNEVGLSIVPDNALARRYRDVLGWVNQRCAAASSEAWLLVSGLPLKLRG